MKQFEIFMDTFLYYLPIIGGIAGFISFIYTFFKSKIKLRIVLPQNLVFIDQGTYFYNDYNPYTKEHDVLEDNSTTIQTDVCIINSSSKDQVLYSIKLKHKDIYYDLNRQEIKNKKCYEPFKIVPLKVKSNSSMLLNISFVAENIHIDELSEMQLFVYYQNNKSYLNLNKANSELSVSGNYY